MYPDNFNNYNLQELISLRTQILANKQKAEEQAMDAKEALKKIQSEIEKRPKNR